MNLFKHLRSISAVAALGAAALLTQQAQAVIVANSVTDFPAFDNASSNSKQNINGWQYGRHFDTVSATPGFSYNAANFVPFADNQGPGLSATDSWDGGKWDVFAGNPPWSELSATGGHPNGSNNGSEQWVIRRWTSDVEGAANVELFFAKTNTASAANQGITGRMFVNGVSMAEIKIAGNDGVGKTWTMHVPSLKAGDVVDIALDPTGFAANANDGSDGSAFRATIDLVKPYASKLVANSITDFPAADNVTANSKQGINNWVYGFHNATTNGTYQANEFIAFADNQGPGVSGTDFWTGSSWDAAPSIAPWTAITANGGHPGGVGQTGGEQWAIRRYIAENNGDHYIESFFAKADLAAGNGIIGQVYHNGLLVYSQLVNFNDGVGFNAVTFLEGVRVGDFIDIVLNPNGADSNDTSLFNAKIYVSHIPEPTTVTLAMLGLMGLGMRRRARQA